MRALGLSAAWDCLDAGAATGTPAVAADSVGAAGSITALDSDTRFLAPLDSARLVALDSDLPAANLPAGRFDVVHSTGSVVCPAARVDPDAPRRRSRHDAEDREDPSSTSDTSQPGYATRPASARSGSARLSWLREVISSLENTFRRW
jgi:hypothetical protein